MMAFRTVAKHSRNLSVSSLDKTSIMSEFDVLEDGAPCDFCGNPISFNDEDWAVCETCQAEYTNMDYQ